MMELPLVFLGGLLGSSHCVGMCGGFALSIGMGARSAPRNVLRQAIFCSGRVFTYGFLGSVAGFAGFWLTRRAGTLVHLQAALSVLAGVFLLVQALLTLGVLPRSILGRLGFSHSAAPCLAGSFLAVFLRSPRLASVFLAGMLNGLLPCGLVYGYLSLASSTASLPRGVATMLAFGAGTVPIMVLTGAGASALSFAARRRVFQVAACCVLITGLIAIARGVVFWNASFSASCPYCA